MLQRSGDIENAVKKYVEALVLNAKHEFTIRNYAELLRQQDRESEATELENKLATGWDI